MISITGNAINDWIDTGIKVDSDPFFIISSGYQKFISRNFKISRDAGRVDFQFIYLVKGKGYYDFGKGLEEVSDGSLIVYLPGQPQNYEYLATDGTELYWLHFTGSQAGEWMSKFNFAGKQVFQIGIRGDCIDLFKKITYEIQDKRPYFQHVAGVYLMELILILTRKLENLRSDNGKAMNETIRSIISYMYENYHHKISVNTLASRCNLSMYRFIHKFKDATGMTPIEYLTKIRIDEARYLLSNSLLNISEIAEIVGYEDPLYFSRVFKKIMGVSPRHYNA